MADEKNLGTENEGKQNEGNQPNNGGAENPPATDEKKGFHPIKAWNDFKKDFAVKHPKAAPRIKTAWDMTKGAGLAVLALGGIGMWKEHQESKEDYAEFLDVTDTTTVSDVPPSDNQ